MKSTAVYYGFGILLTVLIAQPLNTTTHFNAVAQKVKSRFTGKQKFCGGMALGTGIGLATGYLYNRIKANYPKPMTKTPFLGLHDPKVQAIEFYNKHDTQGKDNPYYAFTNFYDGAPFEMDGKKWKTSEHYFQAMKFIRADPAIYNQIFNAKTARNALDIAAWNAARANKNWHKVENGDTIPLKGSVMLVALRAKFTQNKKLIDLLLATGNAELIEKSPTDSYWGSAKQNDGTVGHNMLGKFLMSLRKDFSENY